MGEFLIPDGPEPQPAPPPDPRVAREDKIANDTRVEQALNRFIAAKQETLFEAPDAFYRTQGEDAIHAAPVTTKNLDQLRNTLLDGLANDYQRQRLGDVLDAQMQLTRDGMARHVAEQSLAWQRGVAQDRIALLAKEAALHHNDTDLVDALGHAAANAARAHSRVGDGPPGGEAEDAAAATARSGVLGAAIQARLYRGDATGANALLTRVQGQLDPAHAAPLQGQIEAAQVPPQMHLEPIGPATMESSPSAPIPQASDQGPDATLNDGPVNVDARSSSPDAEQPQPQIPNGQSGGVVAPINYAPADATGPAAPQLAQATPPASAKQPPAPSAANNKKPPTASSQGTSGNISTQQPSSISENELDAALLVLRDMRRKEREPLWEQMIRAKLPDTSPGTGVQAPLSDDWRADVDKINPTYGGFVEKSAKKYGIPPELLARLLAKESNFDIHAGANAVNGRYVPKGDNVAVGIPQMLPAAAKSVGLTRDQLANGTAEFQIDAGARYLAQQFAQAKNWPTAVAAYHSGYGTVANWLNGSGPNFETEDQRREGYVHWDDELKDSKGKKLPSQWRLIQPNPANPKIAAQITTDVSNWNELKKYLPYMFLGDPNRYDSGNVNTRRGR